MIFESNLEFHSVYKLKHRNLSKKNEVASRKFIISFANFFTFISFKRRCKERTNALISVRVVHGDGNFPSRVLRLEQYEVTPCYEKSTIEEEIFFDYTRSNKYNL